MTGLKEVIDRAVSIGALMGEERDLVGMGIVAASAINRMDNPTAYYGRTASLGDIFSAPHTASAMVSSIKEDKALPDTGLSRQYSTTLKSTGPAYDAFRTGVMAELGMTKDLGKYAERYEMANVALNVATKAQEMGLDLGFGATNYGSGWAAGQTAGVGKNPAKYGDHYVGPFPKGQTPPKQSEFAARFAAAAALTGVEIPEKFQTSILAKTTPTEVSLAASVMQTEVQQNLTQKLGMDVMPGVAYNDLTQPTPFDAVNVPDVTKSLGLDAPVGAMGFADPFGITPTNDYETVTDAVPVGQVTSLGPVSDITPQQSTLTGFPQAAPMTGETFNAIQDAGFPAPAPMDQSTFDAIQSAGFPSAAPMSKDTFDAIQSAGFPAAAPMDQGTFDAIQSAGFPAEQPTQTSDFHAGTGEGPYGQTPDASALSLEARNNFDRQMGGVAAFNGNSWNSSDLNPDAIAASLNAELGPKAPQTAQTGPQLSTPSLDTQAMVEGDWADKFGGPQLSTPSVSPQVSAPATVSAPRATPPQGDWNPPDTAPMPPQRPSTDLPSAVPSTPSSGFPLGIKDSIKDALGLPTGVDSGFMDAMANPTLARDFNPGLLDGWTGNALKGAALGALTGGPFGALTGAVLGGLNIGGNITSALGQANGGLFGNGFGGFFDRMSNPFSGMSPEAIAAFGLDGNWTDRAPTRRDESGNASVGDGSYAESSGRNDNNPQGIL